MSIFQFDRNTINFVGREIFRDLSWAVGDWKSQRRGVSSTPLSLVSRHPDDYGALLESSLQWPGPM